MVAPKAIGETEYAVKNLAPVKLAGKAAQSVSNMISKITPDLKTKFANNPTISKMLQRIEDANTPVSIKNSYINILVNNPMTRPFFVEE